MSLHNTDVRALMWINPFLLKYQKGAERAGGLTSYNISTILSAIALRANPSMAKKVCLNIIAHPLGAIHTKIIICGDDTFVHGYVSGIDLLNSRRDGHPHPNHWHDAGVRVEGPAVKGIMSTSNNYGMRIIIL